MANNFFFSNSSYTGGNQDVLDKMFIKANLHTKRTKKVYVFKKFCILKRYTFLPNIHN